MNPDRLKNRARPSDTYWLQVEPTERAGRALATAKETLQLRLLAGADEDATAAAREAVAAAEAELKACYEPITVTALAPAAFEQLVKEHPPRAGSDDDAWNMDTFPRACFLACAPADWDGPEWAAFLDDRLSEAERLRLCNVAVAVNVRVPDPTVPKDWTGTPA
jgi:hypothetical protein